MDYQDKSRGELIAALLKLEQENRELKLSHEKDGIFNPTLVKPEKEKYIDFSLTKEHFELIFNTSPDIAIITRLSDGKVLEVNDTFTKIIGYSREEALNSSSINLKLWNNLEDRKVLINKLLVDGFCENLEVEFVRKDGSCLLGLISSKVFSINNVKCIISTIRDNTKFRQTEETLRKSEIALQKNYAVLNSIFESSQNVIIFSLDANFCYMAFTNSHKQTMKQIWGVDIEIGMNMLDQISNPDDRQKAKTNFDRVLQGEHLRFEEEYGDSKLHRTFFENIYNPIIDSNGVVIGLSVFVIDITARKATEEELRINEERYRLLAENAREVIWTMKLDGTITYISPAVEQLRGLTVEEAMNQPLEQILTPDSQAVSIDYMQRLYSAFVSGLPLPTFRGELEYYRKDGTTLWTESLTYPVLGTGLDSLTILGVTRDITERKQAEEALKQSEERFRSLYANMIDGSAVHSLIYDSQGVPIDYLINVVNPAFEKLLGISRESVINKSSREAYGVDTPPYFEIYSRVALTGTPEVFEAYFAPLDKYFSISVYSPYKGSFATIFENITERKKAEQELQIILTKYRVLFDTFPVGITITDAIGSIVESNPTAETLLGISIEEQEKRKIDGQEWRIVRPDGTTMPASEFASVRALEEGQQVTNVEMGIVKGNNQITWLNVSASPMKIDGYGVAIVYGDITESKLAENEKERTQKLLEDTQRIGKIGGWEVNMDTMELKWTKEMYHIHEVDLTFKPTVDQRTNFYTPESLPVIDKAFQNAIEQGGSYEVDSEIITAKGNRRSVKSIAKVDLENRRVVGLFQDITDRKQFEAELKIKNEQLIELNATKDKFFSIIAHDLKAPFNGILGFSEILRDEARNLDIGLIESYANNINSTAHQTFKLLENLLDWAKMQQNGFSFEPVPISFNYILKNEIESLYSNADQKNIALVNKTAKEIIFPADEKMLSSVLRNLISNAVKFTPKGGEVTIEAQMMIDRIVVSISDTGIGMDKETLQKLFKIEESFTSRGTENEKGTGLGLLLCKEFVEKHGGTIEVESEKGKGSTFTFSIPLTTKTN